MYQTLAQSYLRCRILIRRFLKHFMWQLWVAFKSLSNDMCVVCRSVSLQWRHNERDVGSSHQHHNCLLNRLFRRRSKKTSKLRVSGLCEGNSPATGEFPAQMASSAEIVSIWWRHHESRRDRRSVSCLQTHKNSKTGLRITFSYRPQGKTLHTYP